MSLANLPANELARMLEDPFKMTAVNERIAAASMLRAQELELLLLRATVADLKSKPQMVASDHQPATESP